MFDFHVKTRIRFSLRDKRFFEIIEVEIKRVDCIDIYFSALCLNHQFRKNSLAAIYPNHLQDSCSNMWKPNVPYQSLIDIHITLILVEVMVSAVP